MFTTNVLRRFSVNKGNKIRISQCGDMRDLSAAPVRSAWRHGERCIRAWYSTVGRLLFPQA